MTDNAISAPPSRWNYTPPLPLTTAPFLHWPPKPQATARHLAKAWEPASTRVLMLAVAVIVWRWFSPTLDQAASLRPGWILQIWVRDVVLVALAAGIPHVWLFRWRRQEDELRYDRRPLGKNKRIFLFNDQVKDNIFLSLVIAPIFATAWEVAGWRAYANGWVGTVGFTPRWVWFGAMVFAVPLISALYFSVGHWILHRGPVYTHVHSWHHKNVVVGPWSGLAMHPAEHAVLYSDIVVLSVLPFHPVLMLFFLMHHTLGAPLSHTGYDAIRVAGRWNLPVGDFFHQVHHRFIECNYGGLESPLDDWLDSFHDGTPEGERHISVRRRRLNIARRA